MEQYRFSDNWWSGSLSPIRAGGAEGYISFIGMPPEVRQALLTSKVPPKLYFKMNVYTAEGSPYFGKHKLSAKPTSSTKPWHDGGTYQVQQPTVGWNEWDFTSYLVNDILWGGYQGLTMWHNPNTKLLEGYGAVSNQYWAQWTVEGDWSSAPDKPTITYPTFGVKADSSLTVTWNAPSYYGNVNTLSYDVSITTDGITWKQYTTATTNGVTSFKIDTSTLDQSTKVTVAVRAKDSEYTGAWSYSERFTIFHNIPPAMPTVITPLMGSVVDRTGIIRFAWSPDPKSIQSGYQLRWRTVDSSGNRGAWTYIPSSSTYTNSSDNFYNMPANTLPAFTNIEWGVSTQNEFNLSSAFSIETLFIANNPSTAPVMIYPTASAVVPSTTIALEWTSTFQLQWDATLYSSTGVVLWTSSGIDERYVKVNYTLANNTSYYVKVRVNSNGLWSSYTQTNFSVSYSPPAYPIISKVEEAGSGVTNIMFNAGELGVSLPPLTLDGTTLNTPWIARGNQPFTRLKPINATTYEVDLTGVTGDQYLGISGTFDSTQIPIIAGATYEVMGYSNIAGLRATVWFYDSAGTDLGATGDPVGQVAGSGSKYEVHASRVAPSNVAKVRITFENVFASPMVGSKTIVSGIKLRITSAVTTDSIEIWRREYTPTNSEPWVKLGVVNNKTQITNNLVPPFSDSRWVKHAETTVTSSYVLTNPAPSATFRESYVYIPVEENTTYTFFGGSIGWFARPQTNAGVSTGATMINNVAYSTFTTPAGTQRIMFVASNPTTSATSFINPMLIKGSLANGRPFEPMGDTAIQGGFLDYTPASQVLYEYKVVSCNQANDKRADSVITKFTHTFNDTIIQEVGKITELNFLQIVTSRNSSTEIETALQQFAGRRDPVREFGEHETTTVDLEWEVYNYLEAKAIKTLLEKRQIYLYRDGNGRKYFVSTDKVNMKDRPISGFTMSCTLTRTHFDTDNILY